ncbi:MAG: hypothetical protein WCS30_07000 [Selenomonadaceae bacterium]
MRIEKRTYKSLKIISKIFKGLAVVVLAFGVVASIFMMKNPRMILFTALPALIGPVCMALGLYTSGAMIEMFLDIEENTRIIANNTHVDTIMEKASPTEIIAEPAQESLFDEKASKTD